MVVGDQDIRKRPVPRGESRGDRCGLGRVDQRGAPGGGIMQQIGIIVLQAGHRDDFGSVACLGHGNPSLLRSRSGEGSPCPDQPSSAMHLDVTDLRQFYYRTRLGRIAQKAVRDRMLALWPEAQGQTVGGGVRLCRAAAQALPRAGAAGGGPDARRSRAFDALARGAGQRVGALPRGGSGPCRRASPTRSVCLHGLETSEHPASVLEECARVLGPGGIGALHRAQPLGHVGAPGRDALRFWQALFARPARRRR